MRIKVTRVRLEPLEDRRLLATCNVTRLSDTGGGFGFRGDLRYCINKTESEPGSDTIVFQPTAYGTINLTQELPVILSDVSIVGPGSGISTINNPVGQNRIFSVAGGTVAISGLRMANGRSDVGGAIYNQATLALHDVQLDLNTASSGIGGGIYNAGILTVSASAILGNAAASAHLGLGGGIYNESGASAHTIDTRIQDNLAASQCQGGSCPPMLVAGGGIYNAFGAQLTVERGIISENTLDIGNTTAVSTVFGIGIYNAGTASVASSSITQRAVAPLILRRAGSEPGSTMPARWTLSTAPLLKTKCMSKGATPSRKAGAPIIPRER